MRGGVRHIAKGGLRDSNELGPRGREGVERGLERGSRDMTYI